MKRIMYALSFLMIAFAIKALDIPQGTFYFDNSLTRYQNVKFVYGKYYDSESYIISMTQDEGNRWKITIPQTIPGMYRYTFANTTLPDGKISKTFPDLKNEISNVRKEYRTATSETPIKIGYIYTPETGNNWAQGSWKVLTNNNYGYSETLPVMFITTDNGTPITSKEEYLPGTYYIDNLGLEGYKSFGTPESPLKLQIKGRGNYTWVALEKKPYKLKLDAKANLLGMAKSKHFALMAHADDNLGFLRDMVGFELSRKLGMPWTSDCHPLEVVLNGKYIGLYFLTENIRVDKDRVNIVEQPDFTTAADSITGGWLVEIDNYDTDPHVSITEGNGKNIIFTYKTPEALSSQQSTYLINQMQNINNALYVSDKTSTTWEDYVDIDQLARFYIVQEILDNTESFHGSCYMYKNMDKDSIEKWHFGPVWDFGNAFQRNDKKYIYDDSQFGTVWIGEMCKFPHFISRVKEIWKSFLDTGYKEIDGYIDDFVTQISDAAICDGSRWPQYSNSDMEGKKALFKSKLSNSVNWLKSKWGVSGVESTVSSPKFEIVTNGNSITIISSENIQSINLYDLSGRCVAHSTNTTLSANPGIYILSVTINGYNSHQKVIIR